MFNPGNRAKSSASAFRSLALTKDIQVNEFQGIYSYLAVRIQRLHKATILLAMLMGIAAPSHVHSDPSLVGEWSPLTPLPPVALHMSVLPNGKLIIWPRAGAGSKAYLWDVAANTQTLLPSVQTNIFCSGHTVLADGRLFVAGGHAGPTAAGEGAKETHIFDPVNNTWQQVADMNAGRWYPSTTVLRTGEVLVAAGNKEDKQPNTLPQVFNPATGTYRDLTGAVRVQPLYPWHYVLPDGDVLDAGPDEKTWRLSNVSGVGAWAQVETTNHGLMREAGTSVMYAPGQILIVGGSRVKQEAPTDTAETINMNAASPTWQYTGSLVGGARRHLNATILADGTVLVSGGSSSPDNNAAGAIRAAEIWDPETGLWSVMASMNVPRLYHSSAGLLPDGRVVHAGGGLAPATGDVNHQDAEFFEPPYLFKGPRPEITDALSSVDYGQTFFVETPDAANIARVTWVRLSSTTHSFNFNQRFNELAFSETVGGLTVTAPANSNLSPPGHYMLFILNAEDVPSVAAIIQIGVNASAVPVAEFSGTPTSGTAPLTVSFSDSSTNSPTVWAWDFDGDAITDSTAQNPSFVYNTAGTYTVTLTASNAAGSDAEVKTGYITVSAGGGNVTHQETQSGVSSGLTTVSSASLTGVNGHLYLAAIAATSSKAVSSISGLGLSWSLVRSQCSGRGGIPRIEVWRAQGTPSGNGTVTATFLTAPTHAVIAVSRYSGAGSIGAIVSGNTNGVNGACSGGVDSGAYSFDLSTTVPGAVVYGAVSMRNRTHTPGAGHIERVERAQGSGGTVASVAVEDRPVASASTVVVNGTLGGITDWGVIGLEITP